MLALKTVYVANIIIVSWVSIISLFFPKAAQKKVFDNIFSCTESIRLVGALYLPIFLLSLLGLFFPLKMSLVLLFQLIYKIAWLLFAALPALLKDNPIPKIMTAVFVIYLVILPFVIPWKYIFT